MIRALSRKQGKEDGVLSKKKCSAYGGLKAAGAALLANLARSSAWQ